MQLKRLFAASLFFLCWLAAPVVREGRPGLVLIPYQARIDGRPLSGVAIGWRPNLRLRFFWRGRQFGGEYAWYPSGRLMEHRNFRQGLEHGLQRGWFADGRPRFQLSYVDGKRDGESWSWHPNGQLAEYSRFENDRELAYRSWNAGGKPFYNYTRRAGERIGLQGESYCALKR